VIERDLEPHPLDRGACPFKEDMACNRLEQVIARAGDERGIAVA
jgi:hypothetical protein